MQAPQPVMKPPIDFIMVSHPFISREAHLICLVPIAELGFIGFSFVRFIGTI
jgi:hypothetical protein